MTQMKTSSDEMKVAIIANGKPQSLSLIHI